MTMCNYSLEATRTRDAVVGDKLITSTFDPKASSVGFAAAEDPACAVCLKPGTEIVFDEPAKCGWHNYDCWQPYTANREVLGTVAIISIEPIAMHDMDVLDFPGHKKQLLRYLAAGQTATVIQLPNQREVSCAEQPAQMETA
jgi:hypothetical protein